MQRVHIVITSCNSIIYKVVNGGTQRSNHIKEIKYIDIGSSFIKHIFLSKMQQTVCQSELQFRRNFVSKNRTNKRFHPYMHACSLIEFLRYVV